MSGNNRIVLQPRDLHLLRELAEMIKSPEMMRRRLREGLEFFQFLRSREMAS